VETEKNRDRSSNSDSYLICADEGCLCQTILELKWSRAICISRGLPVI